MSRRLIAIAFLAIFFVPVLPASALLNGPFAWRWSETRDPINDRVIHTASVATLGFKLNGATRIALVTVILACANGEPVLVFDWEEKVAGSRGLIVEYRFDGRPGRRTKANYVRRSRQSTSDLADIRQFLADASVSDGLYVRVQSPAFGSAEARFHARGGGALAARFAQYCPGALGP